MTNNPEKLSQIIDSLTETDPVTRFYVEDGNFMRLKLLKDSQGQVVAVNSGLCEFIKDNTWIVADRTALNTSSFIELAQVILPGIEEVTEAAFSDEAKDRMEAFLERIRLETSRYTLGFQMHIDSIGKYQQLFFVFHIMKLWDEQYDALKDQLEVQNFDQLQEKSLEILSAEGVSMESLVKVGIWSGMREHFSIRIPHHKIAIISCMNALIEVKNDQDLQKINHLSGIALRIHSRQGGILIPQISCEKPLSRLKF